jgi:hypothetical protein
MKFIILFGPLAVGKMTVGHELEKITELKLFHNHMTIELVLPFFDMDSPSFKKLVNSFRTQLLEEVAKSKSNGIIFTYVWELDQKRDDDFVNNIVRIFEKENASVYYVELEADQNERLNRNKSSHRVIHKPSKKDLNASETELLLTDKNFVVNSKPGEFKRKSYLKIDNTKVDAKKTARMIKEKFSL